MLIGLEISAEYYQMAQKAVPVLASMPTDNNGAGNGSSR